MTEETYSLDQAVEEGMPLTADERKLYARVKDRLRMRARRHRERIEKAKAAARAQLIAEGWTQPAPAPAPVQPEPAHDRGGRPPSAALVQRRITVWIAEKRVAADEVKTLLATMGAKMIRDLTPRDRRKFLRHVEAMLSPAVKSEEVAS